MSEGKNDVKIIQIIPAQDWYPELDENAGELEPLPLVCWALCEDVEGNRFVTGIDASDRILDFSDNAEHFKRFVHRPN
ncbi:MAG: hypothetical protein ISS57_04370 [Anaerolineales bacterium]|nr:hypothetical protein [Anaerolineales bacterium]